MLHGLSMCYQLHRYMCLWCRCPEKRSRPGRATIVAESLVVEGQSIWETYHSGDILTRVSGQRILTSRNSYCLAFPLGSTSHITPNFDRNPFKAQHPTCLKAGWVCSRRNLQIKRFPVRNRTRTFLPNMYCFLLYRTKLDIPNITDICICTL
jgi:hypothetical protein